MTSKRSFCILDNSPLSGMCFAKIFLSVSVACHLTLLTVSFVEQRVLILMKPSLISFFCHALCFWSCISKVTAKTTVTYIFSHVIPCKFSVCALHLSLWPIVSSFWLKLLSSLSRFTFFLACGSEVVPALFVEEMILFLLYCFCSCVKRQLTLFVQVYFWALYGLAFYLQICRSCLVSPADPPHAQGST